MYNSIVEKTLNNIRLGNQLEDIAMGNFEILFQKLSLVEQLELLKEEPNFTGLSSEHKRVPVYFSALTEWLCNVKGIEPYEWVNKECYFLKEPTFSLDVCLATEEAKEMGMDLSWLKESLIENAQSEFKRRNYMVTGCLKQV